MNQLNEFERLRPPDERLDVEARERVWRRVVDATDSVVSDVASVATYSSDESMNARSTTVADVRRDAPRRVALVGAAAVIVIGMAAGIAVRSSRIPSAPVVPPAASQPTSGELPRVSDAVAYLPASFPAGYALYDDYRSGLIPTWTATLQVYADTTNSASTERAVAVEVVTGQSTTCGPDASDTTTIDIAGVAATMCTPATGSRQVVWRHDDITIVVSAGRRVDDDELAGFARSMTIGPRTIDDTEPAVTATPSELPAGWELVVDRDALVGTAGEEIRYTVGPTNGRSGGTFVVTIWRGVPNAALWAIRYPIDAGTITINGSDALYDDRDADNPFVFWIAQPGTVILVQGNGGDRDTIARFAEQLVAVDAATVERYVGNSIPAHQQPLTTPTDDPASNRLGG